MVKCRTDRKTPGSCRRTQRSRGGAPSESQPPPRRYRRSASPLSSSSSASRPARASPLAQAHSSMPVPSYRTRPPPMLQQLTARMEAGSAMAPTASLTHLATSDQLPAASKTCEPGTAGSAECDHSRRPSATCRPVTSKRTARMVPVPASTASRCSPSRRDGAGPCSVLLVVGCPSESDPFTMDGCARRSWGSPCPYPR